MVTDRSTEGAAAGFLALMVAWRDGDGPRQRAVRAAKGADIRDLARRCARDGTLTPGMFDLVRSALVARFGTDTGAALHAEFLGAINGPAASGPGGGYRPEGGDGAMTAAY